MITCERCGKEIPDNVAICPNCGTVSSTVKNNPQPPTKHGPYSGRYIDTPPEQAYPPRQDYPDYQPPLTEYTSQQQYHSYGQPFNAPPLYQQPNITSTLVNPHSATPQVARRANQHVHFAKARRRYFSRDSNHASSERPSFSLNVSDGTPDLSCFTAKLSRSSCKVTRFLIPAAFTALAKM